jgi:starvation-inducible outer membrane lipoprotein
MSRLMYSATGNILNKSHIIENMAEPLEQLAKDAPVATAVAQAIQSAKSASAQSASAQQIIPTNEPDYLNLVGNMKIKGAMVATNFYKDDGKTLSVLPSVDVIKFGLPPNVYYVNKKMGINQPNPSYDLDVTGTMGVSGNAIVTSDLTVGKQATFGGKVLAQDDLIVGKQATFGGKVLAQDDLIVGKQARFGGSVLAESDLIGNQARFQGKVLAEDDLIVKKQARFGGPVLAESELTVGKAARFGGPVLAESELTVGKLATFGGRVIAQDELSVGKLATFGSNALFEGGVTLKGKNPEHYRKPSSHMKMAADGIMFGGDNDSTRQDDSAQISAGRHEKNSLNIVGMSSDNVDTHATSRRIDMWAEGGLTLRGKNPEHYRNPSGHMKMAADGIMFGGDNDSTRQPDSAQISAGRWVQNSLNIVGMSLNKDANTRRIDMWAEGGLNVYTKPTDAGGSQLIIGSTDKSNLRLGRHDDYSWIQSHGSKPLQINPIGNNVCIKNVCSQPEGILLCKLYSNKPNGTEYQRIREFSINDKDFNDDMNILKLLSENPANAISRTNIKGAVYFNIALKAPNRDESTNATFSVSADDGVAFECQNNNYLTSSWDQNEFTTNDATKSVWTTDLIKSVNMTNSININKSGWKLQPTTKYDFVIPNYSLDSISSIVRCRITYYQNEGGLDFIIKGLKTAITKLGKLV